MSERADRSQSEASLKPCPECGFGHDGATAFCPDCGRDLRPPSFWQRLLRRPSARASRSLRQQQTRISEELARVEGDIERFERQRRELLAQREAALGAGRDVGALNRAGEAMDQALEERRSLLPRYRALHQEIDLDRAENQLRLLLTRLDADDGAGLRGVLESEPSRCATRTTAHQGRCVATTFVGDHLASVGEDGQLRLWSVPDLELLQQLATPSPLRALAALQGEPSEGSLLAAGGLEAELRCWRLTEAGELSDAGPQRLRGHGDWISALAWRPDGGLLASACGAGQLRLWLVDQGRLEERSMVLIPKGPLIRSLAFSPGGGLLAVARLRGPVELWRLPTTAKGMRLPSAAAAEAGLSAGFGALGLSADGRLLTSAAGRRLELYSLEEGFVVSQLASEATIGDHAFHPSSALLAVGGTDGAVELFAGNGSGWDRGSQGAGEAGWLDQAVQRLDDHPSPCRSVSFSPQGRFLASASEAGALSLWDLERPSIRRLARGAILSVDALMGDLELLRCSEGRRVGDHAWRYLGELATALAHVQARRLLALPLETSSEVEIPALRRRVATFLAEVMPLVTSLYPRESSTLPGALLKYLEALPSKLLGALCDTLLSTTSAQLDGLHSASEADCDQRAARLRGCQALAAELPTALGVAGLEGPLEAVEDTAARLPELLDLVLARRATAAVGVVSPFDDEAPLAELAAEREAVLAGEIARAELAAAEAEVEALLSGARGDDVNQRDQALLAIEREAARLGDQRDAIREVDKLLSE